MVRRVNENKNGEMMRIQTTGFVRKTAKCPVKFNPKPVLSNLPGHSVFPVVVWVDYEVEGKRYLAKKWFFPGTSVPQPGSRITVIYEPEHPAKGKIRL